MKKAKQILLKLWKDESGQGATEYILLLVAVVAVGLIFKDKIVEIVNSQIDKVQGGLSGLNTGG